MKAYWETINERHDINKFDFIYLNNEQTFTLSTLISTATDVKIFWNFQITSKNNQSIEYDWAWLHQATLMSSSTRSLMSVKFSWESAVSSASTVASSSHYTPSLSLSVSSSQDDHLQYPLCQQPPHHLPPGAQRPEPLVLGLGSEAAGHCNPSSSGWAGGG